MRDKIRERLKRWLRPIKEALLHFDESDGWAMASHVAMSLMIAVFPFLIFAVSLTGLLGADGLSNEIVHLVFDYWPDAIAKPIVNEIKAVVATANKGFLTFGIVLAIIFASNGIEAIRVALNRAYGDSDEQPIWKQRLQSLIFVIVGAILILLISVLLVFLPIYFSFIEVDSLTVYNWLFHSETVRWFAAFGLLILLMFACHHWLPGRRRPIGRIWPGILMTLALWIVVATGFSLYLESFANYSATYAGLAGIMTALIFLYLMAAIFIFGAEYNSAREKAKIIQRPTVSH
ncbi:MAG: YihY/virulence factor BrkB family protein [Pseudomonadota bacterium]